MNEDLRLQMRIADVRQWELADEMGIGEATLVRKLRYKLLPDVREELLAAIKVVAKKKNPLYGMGYKEMLALKQNHPDLYEKCTRKDTGDE